MNKYKKDFPIFKQKINGHPLVYLDSAATSQKPQVVIDAVNEFYQEYNSNIHRGIYAIAEKATKRVEEVRRKVARFVSAKNLSEIVFTHGTTEGINILASSFGAHFSKNSGVLLSEMEHHSNLVPWQHYANLADSPLDYLQVKEDGLLDGTVINSHGKLKKNNTNNYTVISVTHVSNVLGTINTITKIREKSIDGKKNPILIVDAAQSVPHMVVDVQKMGADFLVFSGHKMFSPTGVGILWGRKKLLSQISPFIYGSQMIREVTLETSTFEEPPAKFEPGTLPLEAIVGLGAAVDYMSEIGMNTIYTHEQNLTKYALETLTKISGLTVYGPKNAEMRSGVIAFSLDGIHPHDIAQVLAQSNICVRAGHHCAMPLHKKLGVRATVRVSFNIYNSEEDVEMLLKGIVEAKKIFSV